MAKISFSLVPWLVTIALIISGAYFIIQSLLSESVQILSTTQMLNSHQLITGAALILWAIITFSLWCITE